MSYLVTAYDYKNLNGFEMRIENSVTRVTVRHHEAHLVMPNSYPSDGIFNSHRQSLWIIFLAYSSFDIYIYA